MKKRKNKKIGKICLVILITSVLLSLLVVLAYADENTNTNTSCLGEHFAWVEDEGATSASDEEHRMPYNVRGSCPYIAMSLMLSYYDAYWDDRFVPDTHYYERKGTISSSGEISSDFHLELENDAWLEKTEALGLVRGSSEEKAEYSDFVDEHSEEYFHLYLISLAKERNYHPFEISYGLINAEMVLFLRYYLYDICGFSEDQVSVHLMTKANSSDDELYAKAQEQIDKGFPFMYTGLMVDVGNNDEIETPIGAHVLLGYKYTNNETKDDITLSYCWNERDTTTFYTNEFRYYSGIIWLEINKEELPHTCSYSYSHMDGNGFVHNYCTCQVYSEHPNHTCKLPANQQDPCPNSQSYVNCLCGQQINGYHSYHYNNEYSSLYHFIECVCGYESKENHILESVYNEASGTHYYTCWCGYQTSTHSMNTYSQYYISDDNYNLREFMHKVSCECGYETQAPHDFVITGLGTSRCTDCGYVRVGLGGGGNVIMGKKEDEEEE